MKFEDVIPGMKVVPHSKSLGGGLDMSTVWDRSQKEDQPFLYVTGHDPEEHGECVILNEVNVLGDGDFFLPSDFEPYTK